MDNWAVDEKLAALLGKSLDLAALPLRKATSKTAQRAYLGTAFLFVASIVLLGLSAVAYLLFYYNYVPQIGITKPVYLQFGDGHPYGTAHLSSVLISQQAYDIKIALHLPRTPSNLATGNFMVDLSLLGPSDPGSSFVEKLMSGQSSIDRSESVLARSRRPGILTYTSAVVETAHVVVNLPLMVTGWKRESERLEISMFEGIEFPRGSINVPERVHVAIQADDKMQFYEAEIRIRARFRGLRWIMYNHRIISFMFFTSGFFTVSTSSALLIYFLFNAYTSEETTKNESTKQVKREESDQESELVNPLSTSDLSDTARAFPAFGRRRPLEFAGRSTTDVQIKQEDIAESAGIEPLEADDEEESGGEGSSTWRDSGIGTGREERGRRPAPRRRRASQDL